MSLITLSDINDLSLKLGQQSSRFFLSKLNLFSSKRVSGHWDYFNMPPVNWWNIPKVRQRWNEKITGSPDTGYISYLDQKYFNGRQNLSMLSIGCGTGSQELQFAKLGCFSNLDAFDISSASIESARKRAASEQLNINFFTSDFWQFETQKTYDVILFFSSLHHVKNVKQALEKVKQWLAPGGLLIIHEYTGPNRIQFSDKQLSVVNGLLKEIPKTHRRFWRSKRNKNKQYRPGTLRMILTDPSEAVDAESIIPAVSELFQTKELKPYGGNILQPLLKGISHHFAEDSEENRNLLQKLFDAEDAFLRQAQSDFHFGVFCKAS